MLNYLLAAVIAAAAAGAVIAWFSLRIRARNRIPSLNSLRDATRRGVQRTTIRARTDRSSEDALNGMIADLK
jgi:hypothetical protein